jgi:hypothetical protein
MNQVSKCFLLTSFFCTFAETFKIHCMKRLFVAVFLFSLSVSQAQVISSRYYEFGVFTGTLNGTNAITRPFDFSPTIEEIQPEFGIFLKRHLSHYIFIGAEASYGRLVADDLNRGNSRRLGMNTPILGASALAGVNFRRFGKYFKRNSGTPYIMLGVGTFNYSPNIDETRLYPADYDLYPASYFAFNFKAAFGYKFRLSMHSFMAIEAHTNFTSKNNLTGWVAPLNAQNDGFFGLRISYSYGFFDN